MSWNTLIYTMSCTDFVFHRVGSVSTHFWGNPGPVDRLAGGHELGGIVEQAPLGSEGGGVGLAAVAADVVADLSRLLGAQVAGRQGGGQLRHVLWRAREGHQAKSQSYKVNFSVQYNKYFPRETRVSLRRTRMCVHLKRTTWKENWIIIKSDC